MRRLDDLCHLDMTKVWTAEHGWVYLRGAVDCCTHEIVRGHSRQPSGRQCGVGLTRSCTAWCERQAEEDVAASSDVGRF